jgi:hypothetical protein
MLDHIGEKKTCDNAHGLGHPSHEQVVARAENTVYVEYLCVIKLSKLINYGYKCKYAEWAEKVAEELFTPGHRSRFDAAVHYRLLKKAS